MKKSLIFRVAAAAVIFSACNTSNTNTATSDTAITTQDADAKVPVTSQNFAHAMIDMAMQKEFALGADNKWYHHRKPMPLNEQPAPLMNRDTEYSFAILDGRGGVALRFRQTMAVICRCMWSITIILPTRYITGRGAT